VFTILIINNLTRVDFTLFSTHQCRFSTLFSAFYFFLRFLGWYFRYGNLFYGFYERVKKKSTHFFLSNTYSKKVMYTFDDNEAKRKVDFFLDRGYYYFGLLQFFWLFSIEHPVFCCGFPVFHWGLTPY